jgi:hypothetical protein
VLKEMIDALGDLTRKAAAPVPVPILDPRKVSFVVNGMQVTQDVPPTPRDHKAGSLDEIIALANRFGEGATDLGEGQPVVWYDEEKVVLVIDDSGHRVERATLTLDTSDVFACLCRLSKAREWMDQKPFVRLLKLDLAGKVEPPYLIDRARKLKFEATSSSTGVVQRDRESLGRNITSEVTSDGDIPEEVLVNAPVFKTAGERDPYPVACAVETDPAMGKLRLVPLPDEVERVRQLAVASIGGRLATGLKEGVNAYYGKP